ncbi:MAG: helix-turn-helix transcriptional regulator [Clostridia bacterium]|nr:helix-turn-helix transcriptional regulator [Clostridia bacterium]
MIRLRDLREDSDLTQAQCAAIANISKNSYIRYENGMRSVPSDVIAIYAKYYKVSADYLLGLIDYPRPL